MHNRTKILGITGPTGSGKSTLCSELNRIGYNIIDCDKLNKEIQENDSSVQEKMRKCFGNSIFDDDNRMTIDRKALARIVFSSKIEMNKLTSIIYPEIIKKIISIANDLKGNSILIIDAPTLFESGIDVICDKTLSIISPRNLRLDRIMKRDNINLEQAKLRMNFQMNDEFYINKSDFVLDGSTKIEHLIENILNILKSM